MSTFTHPLSHSKPVSTNKAILKNVWLQILDLTIISLKLQNVSFPLN